MYELQCIYIYIYIYTYAIIIINHAYIHANHTIVGRKNRVRQETDKVHEKRLKLHCSRKLHSKDILVTCFRSCKLISLWILTYLHCGYGSAATGLFISHSLSHSLSSLFPSDMWLVSHSSYIIFTHLYISNHNSHIATTQISLQKQDYL